MFSKDIIQLGDLEYDSNHEPIFIEKHEVLTRVYDKKSVSFDGNDEVLDFDKQAVIYNFNPENLNGAKIGDNIYRIVEVKSFQAVQNKTRYQISLKLFK